MPAPINLRITVIKTIHVKNPPCNPLALYWLNKKGGWDMWCFGGTQTNGHDIKNGEEFEKYIANLAGVIGRKQVLTKSEVPTITLGYESLSTNDVNGIKGILSSIKVLMLVSKVNILPPVWREVNVDPGSYNTIEVENGFHNLEFTISLAEQFIQSL